MRVNNWRKLWSMVLSESEVAEGIVEMVIEDQDVLRHSQKIKWSQTEIVRVVNIGMIDREGMPKNFYNK